MVHRDDEHVTNGSNSVFCACAMSVTFDQRKFLGGSTSTPAGVGPIRSGQAVEVEITGLGILRNPARGA